MCLVPRYQVNAERSGAWWALGLDDLPGVHSQAKSLHQAETYASEDIALATDEDPTNIAVVVNAMRRPCSGSRSSA